MKIYEIVAESAHKNHVRLTESQITEIASLFGNDLTEAQLHEIAAGAFLKKLVITAATTAALLGSMVAHGQSVPPDLQGIAKQTVSVQQDAKSDPGRYQEIAAKLNDQREVGHQYSIKLSNTGGPAEAQVWKQSASSHDPRDPRAGYSAQVPTVQCSITVNPKYLNNLSDDAVAWVLGHEIAHCELKHGGGHLDPNKNWDQEYNADQLGAKLAQKAGYNPQSAYKEMTFLKQHEKEVKADYQSSTHPDIDARMANLSGAKRQQAAIMKPSSEPTATKLAQGPDGSITLK